MSDEDVVAQVRRVLTAPLGSLVDSSVASFGLPELVSQWSFGIDDRNALLTYGVPAERDDADGVQLVGDVQRSVAPELFVEGQPAYRLGFHWWRTLAAASPTGEVWAVAPLTAETPLATHVLGSATIRVNSSVTSFVDVAWRWHHMRPLLLSLGYGDGFFDAAEIYLERLPELDEALADEERFSWWRSLILDW